MVEADIDEADRVLRLAFGVFLGLPDPETFRGDSVVVRPRWLLDPTAAYVAEAGGKILGSVFAANWGSVGFVGPITVRPDLWDHGIGRFLMEPVTDLLDSWGSKLAGLVTYPQSPKHVAFYQKFDFWPRSLSVMMSRAITQSPHLGQGALFSEMNQVQQQDCLDAIRDLTGSIFPGLDLTYEIRNVDQHHFGDTVLMWEGGRLEGMAVCHIGSGTEAGGGSRAADRGDGRAEHRRAGDFHGWRGGGVGDETGDGDGALAASDDHQLLLREHLDRFPHGSFAVFRTVCREEYLFNSRCRTDFRHSITSCCLISHEKAVA